jgi:serine/threonine protein kinase
VNHLGEASVVGGRFRLVQPVQADDPVGAWRAIDQLAGDEVVIKPLGAYPVDDMAARGRFRLAAEAVLELSGPAIAEVLDFGEAPLPDGLSAPYLVRELVSGRTLDQRLGDGPLASGDALRIVAAVAGALAVAHRAGVVHGHVVPANIVLGSDNVTVTDFGVTVTDFGVTVTVTDFGLSALDYRRVGAAPGVLSAVAPELADGGLATPASDMYALGVVFVACLAGITSARGADGSRPIAGTEPLGALAFEPVPAGLASLWAACLRPSPMDRPTAAHAVALSRQLVSGTEPGAIPELSSLLEAGPVQARIPGEPIPLGALGEPGSAGQRPAAQLGVDQLPADRLPAAQLGAGPDPDAPGSAEPAWARGSRSRRRRLIAAGGIAAAAAAAVVVLLVSSLAPQQASPVSSATADRTRTDAPATSRSAAAGQPSAGRPPSPEATSSVLASTPAVSLSPLAVIGRISQTISKDVASRQMRPDVGVDLNNLIQPVQTELAAGEQAPVAQLADTLRAKLQTRLSEGAVSAAEVQVLDGELTTLRRSASG